MKFNLSNRSIEGKTETGSGVLKFDGELKSGSGGQGGISKIDLKTIHPPTPNFQGFEHPDLQESILGHSGDMDQAMKSLGHYWAEQKGITWDIHEGAEFEGFGMDIEVKATDDAFVEQYQPVFQSDIEIWQEDWGPDTIWGASGTYPEAWEDHGGQRKLFVDEPFLTSMRSKLNTFIANTGYDNQVLINETFQGYGTKAEDGINAQAVRERSINPDLVIGTQSEVTGKLSGGELTRTSDPYSASGDWGTYLVAEDKALDDKIEDKKDAKEAFEIEKKSIKDQKRALSQKSAPGLRDARGRETVSGLKRGGRGAGGFLRGDVESIVAQSKQLGALRKKARLAYNNALEKADKEARLKIDSAAHTLRGEVKTDFEELAGDIETAKIEYQEDNINQENKRGESIFLALERIERANPTYPWPGVEKEEEEEEEEGK